MVLGVEGERDSVADGGIDLRGVECKYAILTNCDWDVCRRDSQGNGGEDSGGEGEMHLGLCFV